MERNLLYNEIANLNNSFDSEMKDYFFSTSFENLLEKKYPHMNIYGGYALKPGDNDDGGVYEGIVVKSKSKSNHVKELQNDLIELGIGIRSKSPDGIFDFETELAVREFQIYAKMSYLAQVGIGPTLYYGDIFLSSINRYKYKGAINGVLDAQIRRRIQYWKANNLKCPVIVRAWNIDKAGNPSSIFSNNDNIWRYNEVLSTAPRMYVADFSQYYTFPSNRNSNSVVIGDFSNSGWGGPRSEDGPSRSWAETEITPDSLLGKPLTTLTVSEKSTFMVIRAVSSVECEGYLDRMNAYDNAFVSFGPFHWVLGLVSSKKTKVDGGEIASFIAYLKEKDLTSFEKAFGFFGLVPNSDWNISGQDFFYSGGVRNYGKGRPMILRGTSFNAMPNDKTGIEFGNYFRSWHWFYRFLMAARTIPGFIQYIWDFARLRIRDISSIPLKSFGFTNSQGHQIDPSISDIFTSERAFAMILRLHVRYPAHVANVNNQDKGLKTILKNSLAQMKREGLNSKDFANWGQRHQEIIVENIANYYPPSKGVSGSLVTVRDFVFSGISLSVSKNSFRFDSSNLSPAPKY